MPTATQNVLLVHDTPVYLKYRLGCGLGSSNHDLPFHDCTIANSVELFVPSGTYRVPTAMQNAVLVQDTAVRSAGNVGVPNVDPPDQVAPARRRMRATADAALWPTAAQASVARQETPPNATYPLEALGCVVVVAPCSGPEVDVLGVADALCGCEVFALAVVPAGPHPATSNVLSPSMAPTLIVSDLDDEQRRPEVTLARRT